MGYSKVLARGLVAAIPALAIYLLWRDGHEAFAVAIIAWVLFMFAHEVGDAEHKLGNRLDELNLSLDKLNENFEDDPGLEEE